MTLLLELAVKDEQMKEKLEAMGLCANNQSLLVFSMFQQALKGNQKAVESIIKLLL
ncbi:hypothetical protein KG091_04505 [Carnobacteriaceae bacterium zg-ZUI78]|nr:hypothetical protein [Carnobacteriaceae bacterium zg-ZUI78]